jgi:hypothetical protein
MHQIVPTVAHPHLLLLQQGTLMALIALQKTKQTFRRPATMKQLQRVRAKSVVDAANIEQFIE